APGQGQEGQAPAPPTAKKDEDRAASTRTRCVERLRRLCRIRPGERLGLGPGLVVARETGPLESRRVPTRLSGPSVSTAPLLRSPRGDGRVSGLCRSRADPGHATGTGPPGDAPPDPSAALRAERWR